jgi:RNA polymerase sigma-70 factor (ECF subfamily)
MICLPSRNCGHHTATLAVHRNCQPNPAPRVDAMTTQRTSDEVDALASCGGIGPVSLAKPAFAEIAVAARPVARSIEAFLASIERRAWRVAEMALNDGDEALDAVQDAMLRLVRHYGDKPADEWAPLFWGILRRRITDLQRRRSVRNRILVWTGRARQDEDGDELPAWDAPDPGPDPARALAARQSHAAMSQAIRALPRRQQQVFTLRVLEGLDVADTARAMGCSEGSVKTHLSRALESLRGQLEAWR